MFHIEAYRTAKEEQPNADVTWGSGQIYLEGQSSVVRKHSSFWATQEKDR